MQSIGASTANAEPEAATGELCLAPPASALEAFGSGLQVVSHGQCLWCNSVAMGTESLDLAEWPKTAHVLIVTSFLGAQAPFGPSRAELFESTVELSVV